MTSYRADASESGHVDIVYNEYGDELIGYMATGLGRSSVNGVLQPPTIKEDTGKVDAIHYEREYDSNGNLVRMTQTYTKYENMIYNYEYDYDSTGKKICCRSYRNDHDTYENTFYEYDSDGNLIHSEEYRVPSGNPDGVPDYETFYEYNSEGREAKNEYYGYLGEQQMFIRRVEHEYTDDGQLLKVSYYDSDGLTEYRIYYQDEHAEEVYLVSNGQEMLFERIEYTYI